MKPEKLNRYRFEDEDSHMKERRSIRYETQLIPKRLRKVTVSWVADYAVEADVANFCVYGMKVLFQFLEPPPVIPKKNDIVRVKLPIFNVWLTGKCIYVTREHSDSVSMGICYFVPIQQSDFNELLGKTLEVPLRSCAVDCHKR